MGGHIPGWTYIIRDNFPVGLVLGSHDKVWKNLYDRDNVDIVSRIFVD